MYNTEEFHGKNKKMFNMYDRLCYHDCIYNGKRKDFYETRHNI